MLRRLKKLPLHSFIAVQRYRNNPMTSNDDRKALQQSVLKFEFYLLSLWLLFLLIIIIKIDVPICFERGCEFVGVLDLLQRNILPVCSLLFILIGLFFYWRFKYRLESSNEIPVLITEIEDLSYEHLTFLTTYIVPLICFNLDSARYVLSLFLLLFVIGLIYVKTDKFYANPTLAVLGFRLYKVTTEFGCKVVITKARLAKGDRIAFINLDDKFVYGRIS
ncbi:hypothetical protein PALA51_05053 [Pseudomonas aeruginosa]|nr:hypothetical protein PALA51_05053 [Pseudomonas aeruginosa]